MRVAGNRMVEEAVTARISLGIVARWTGVPVDKMIEGEREKLLAHGGVLQQPCDRPGQAVTAVAPTRCAAPVPVCRIRTGP